MVDPTTPVQMKRLCESMDWSYRQMATRRAARTYITQQQVGSHLLEGGAKRKVPVNYLRWAKQIIGRQLAARTPRAHITTEFDHLEADAADIKAGLNQLVEEINFGETHARWVNDALDNVGILKVGVETRFPGGTRGNLHNEHQVFADIVDFDDFGLDMTAKRYEAVDFAWDRYPVPLWAAKECELFDKVARGRLTAAGQPMTGEDGQGRVDEMGRGLDYDEHTAYEQVWLRDIWLPPPFNMLLTIWDEMRGEDTAVLFAEDWEGPEWGFYHLLGYGDIASQPLPYPPLHLILDLADLANSLYTKVSDQAKRFKKFVAFRRGAPSDTKQIEDVADGGGVSLMSADFSEVTVGGVDNGTLLAFMNAGDLINELMSNLRMMAGSGPTADTATQEQMVAQNSAGTIGDYRDRTVKATKRAMESMGWYMFHDPAFRIHTRKEDRFGNSLPVTVTPQTIEGDYWQYNFEVVPHSITHKSPEMHLAEIHKALDRLAPHLQFMMQQGLTIDYPLLVQLMAEYSDTPQIARILTFAAAQGEGQQAPVGERPPQMAHTTRETIRRPGDGMRPQGKSDVMQQLLMGSKLQGPGMGALAGGAG